MDENFIEKIHNQVKGGTPNYRSQPLCVTCRSATTMQGYSKSEYIVHCARFDKNVPFPIYQCSGYDDKRQASVYDMKEIAWVLVTKKMGRDIGFVSAKDYRKRKEEDEEE